MAPNPLRTLFTQTFWFPNWSVEKIPSLAGKTVLVTGATAGLGFETCLQLAKKGAHVFCVGRNETKLQETVQSILAATGNSKIEYLVADSLDLASVEKAADEFLAKGLKLDILVNNAGIMHAPYNLSKQGIESQFATNHFATVVLTQRLIPALTDKSRIVTLSSLAHFNYVAESGIHYDLLNNEEKYDCKVRYAETKLANVHFTKFLQQTLAEAGKNVYVNCCHPGVVKTELFKHDSSLNRVKNWLFISVPKGALTQLFLAADKSIEDEDVRGEYFEAYCTKAEASAAALNKDFIQKTADWTAEVLKAKYRADWTW